MTAREMRFECFYFHQKIFIFRKVTADLVTLMEKTDATFHCHRNFAFRDFTKGFPIKCDMKSRMSFSPTANFRKIKIFDEIKSIRSAFLLR